MSIAGGAAESGPTPEPKQVAVIGEHATSVTRAQARGEARFPRFGQPSVASVCRRVIRTRARQIHAAFAIVVEAREGVTIVRDQANSIPKIAIQIKIDTLRRLL